MKGSGNERNPEWGSAPEANQALPEGKGEAPKVAKKIKKSGSGGKAAAATGTADNRKRQEQR